MSGLLGSPGPGILGKMFGEIESKYASSEKPGFSGTMTQDKDGNWVSIDAGKDAKRRKAKRNTYLVGTALTGLPHF